jgi:methyl-accepting chemotaxis protein
VGPTTLRPAVEGAKYEGVVRFALPVFDEQGEFDGIVMLSLDHRHIMEFVMHILPTDEQYTVFPDYASGNYAWMFDNEGWQIAHPRYGGLRGLDESGALVPAVNENTPPEQRRNQPFNLRFADWVDPSFRQMYEAVMRGETGLQTIANQAGVERAITYAPIPFSYGRYRSSGFFGGVTLGANVEEFHRDASLVRNSVAAAQDRLRRNILWLGALVIGLIGLLSVVIARTISLPVLRLTEASREMATGSLNVAVLNSLFERRVGDEITELAIVFKQMAEQVQLREKRLKDEIQQLNIRIDDQKASHQVSEITETEYFQNLVDRAAQLRQQRTNSAARET